MSLRQILSYDLGKVVPVAVAIVYFGSQVPSSLLPRYFVNKFHKLRDEDGQELETSRNTELIFNREICESGIENENLASILTFVCPGDEAISKGTIATRFDCMIGLPHYFNYESRSDVDAVDLDRILNLKLSHHYRRMRQTIEKLFGSSSSESSEIGNKIDWSSPAGVAYKQSLVLSPLAKRFAMTRVVHETDRAFLLYGFACIFIGTELAAFLYRQSLKGMSPAERRLYKGRYLLATWALGFAVWFGVCKIRNNFFERTSDEKAASYGPDLAEGGLEYYDKMLARNKALRELLGKEGEKRFTAKGQPRFCFSNWIQDFTLPFFHRTLMSRRKTVKAILDELEDMTYEELEEYLEAQRIHRRPRKSLFTPMKGGLRWKNEQAEELDRSAGVLEYDAKLAEAFKRTKRGG